MEDLFEKDNGMFVSEEDALSDTLLAADIETVAWGEQPDMETLGLSDTLSTEMPEEETMGLADTRPAEEEESFFGDDIGVSMVVIDGKRQQYRFENSTNSRLGGGNQATVYVCSGIDDNNEYAVKLYNPEKINEGKLQDILRFLETNHFPHMTNLLEYGMCTIAGGRYYYAIMDLYEKVDRRQYLWNNSDNEVYRNRIVNFVEQMNNAMRCMHSNGFYHGDIKPDNIMLEKRTKDIVLVDFGGATKAKEYGRSEKAAATTAMYAAPETVRNNGKISAYSDYYLLGVSLAEYMNGVHPGQEATIVERFENVRKINYYCVPENLPKHYLNLLRGLLYENSNADETKSHRWETKKVDEWLAYMKSGNYVQAAKCNSVPEGGVAVSGANESQWDFGNDLSLELGDEDYVFKNLSEMSDAFVEHWDEGMDIMLNEMEAFGSIRADIRNIIRKASDRIQNVDIETGHSSNAEYFKFLYKYLSDKNSFYWKDLPGVHSKEDFAERLLLMLEKKKNEDYDFGEWWRNISDNIRSNSTVFAEIFRNQVFSFYLKKSDGVDEAVIAQCEKVERIFRRTQEHYTYEEIAEMYTLAYQILGITDYETSSGRVFDTYQEFLDEVRNIAYDPKRVKESAGLMQSVKRNGRFTPDFLAWKNLQEGNV